MKRAGEDVTIVATSSMVQVALGAAKLLEEYDVSAEVVDPRTLWPLDERTLIESAKKTSRVIVVDEGVPIPFSPPLEDSTVPTETSVFEAALALCGRSA